MTTTGWWTNDLRLERWTANRPTKNAIVQPVQQQAACSVAIYSHSSSSTPFSLPPRKISVTLSDCLCAKHGLVLAVGVEDQKIMKMGTSGGSQLEEWWWWWWWCVAAKVKQGLVHRTPRTCALFAVFFSECSSSPPSSMPPCCMQARPFFVLLA